MNASAATWPASARDWSELNRQWLIAAIGRLAPAAGSARHRRAAERGRGLRSKRRRAADFTPALVHCARIFGLSPFERELLLLVAGLELDERLAVAPSRPRATAPRRRRAFGLALARPDAAALGRAVAGRAAAPLAHGRARAGRQPRPGSRCASMSASCTTSPASLPPMPRWPALPVRSACEPDSDETDPALVERIARALDARSRPLRTGRRAARSRSRPGRPPRPGAGRAGAARPAGALVGGARSAGRSGSLLRLATHVDRETALTGVRAGPLVRRSRHGTGCARARRAAAQRRAAGWARRRRSFSRCRKAGRVLRFDLPAPDARRTRLALRKHWQRLAPADASRGCGRACRARPRRTAVPSRTGGARRRSRAGAGGGAGRSRGGDLAGRARGGARRPRCASPSASRRGRRFDDVVLPAGAERHAARHRPPSAPARARLSRMGLRRQAPARPGPGGAVRRRIRHRQDAGRRSHRQRGRPRPLPRRSRDRWSASTSARPRRT